jgi:hypothetical protein
MGFPPLGDEMAVSPLIWRKKPMDSISGNLDYIEKFVTAQAHQEVNHSLVQNR